MKNSEKKKSRLGKALRITAIALCVLLLVPMLVVEAGRLVTLAKNRISSKNGVDESIFVDLCGQPVAFALLLLAQARQLERAPDSGLGLFVTSFLVQVFSLLVFQIKVGILCKRANGQKHQKKKEDGLFHGIIG